MRTLKLILFGATAVGLLGAGPGGGPSLRSRLSIPSDFAGNGVRQDSPAACRELCVAIRIHLEGSDAFFAGSFDVEPGYQQVRESFRVEGSVRAGAVEMKLTPTDIQDDRRFFVSGSFVIHPNGGPRFVGNAEQIGPISGGAFVRFFTVPKV